MSPPTLRAELAAAIRKVNAAYSRLTPDQRTRVSLVADGPLDSALLSGSHAKALAQIETWRDRQLAAIAQVERRAA